MEKTPTANMENGGKSTTEESPINLPPQTQTLELQESDRGKEDGKPMEKEKNLAQTRLNFFPRIQTDNNEQKQKQKRKKHGKVEAKAPTEEEDRSPTNGGRKKKKRKENLETDTTNDKKSGDNKEEKKKANPKKKLEGKLWQLIQDDDILDFMNSFDEQTYLTTSMAKDAGYGKMSDQANKSEHIDREALLAGFSQDFDIPQQQTVAMGIGSPLSSMTEGMIAARDLLFTKLTEIRDEEDGEYQQAEITPQKPDQTEETAEEPTPPMSNKSKPDETMNPSPSSQSTKLAKKLDKKTKKKEKKQKKQKQKQKEKPTKKITLQPDEDLRRVRTHTAAKFRAYVNRYDVKLRAASGENAEAEAIKICSTFMALLKESDPNVVLLPYSKIHADFSAKFG